MTAEAHAAPRLVATRRMGAITELQPEQSLDSQPPIDELLAAAVACLESGNTKLLIDFTRVKLVNSAGLVLIFDLQDRLLRP